MSPDYLFQLGVIYRHCPSVSDVNEIASQRSYKNRDEITVSPEKMGPMYEEKVRMFFNEHLHEDEEIRYILEGHGFFDVRNGQDEWVRIRLEAEDLIVKLLSLAMNLVIFMVWKATLKFRQGIVLPSPEYLPLREYLTRI